MNEVINVIKKHRKIILLTIYILLFIIYLIKPICFDVKIYLEAAQRADTIGDFPGNIIDAWEHKYILNRLLFYVIFKIAKLFLFVDNLILFEIIVKAIYGLIGILIIKIFSKSTKKFFNKYEISDTIVFGLLYFVVIGSGIYFSLQTELTALLITLIAIIFVLKDKPYYKIFSGLIISTLFWLKGVTLLYSIMVLAVMLLSNYKKKDILLVISSSFAFLFLEILLMYYFSPNEIKNMYLATQYITYENTFRDLIMYFIRLTYEYNLFTCGVTAFIINVICHIKTRNIKLFILEALVWVVLWVGVLIQKLTLIYQSGLIGIAIIFSIFIFLYYNKKQIVKSRNVIFKIIGPLLIMIILANILFEILISTEIYKTTFDAIKQTKILEEQIPDLKSGEILYIGNGLSSYYIKANSYTCYVTTIFLANKNETYINSEYINELKNKIKNYTGKYIIVDKNEFLEKFRISDDIIQYINANYHYKTDTNISVLEYFVEDVTYPELYYSAIYERNN